jgi:peptide/nickel transport system substrate-binding protein
MQFITKTKASGIVMVVLALLAAPGFPLRGAERGKAVLQPQYGGTLRICNLAADGISIGYPPKLLRTQSNRIAGAAVETLLRTDTSGKPVPWLATGYKEDAQAKTITLRVRTGVKFHDGTDFNAEAVKWNLDQCWAEKNPGTEKFKTVDVVNDSTVRITLNEWDSTVVSNLTQTIGLIVSPTSSKKNGEQWAQSHPVGTGPFEFVSWEKDVRVVFKKFPGYWQKGKPYLDRIEFIIITDTVTQEMSLRAKELDLRLTLRTKGVPEFEKEGFVVLRTKPGSGAYGLVPDSGNPKSPWADVRVRRAAAHAIDRETIAKTIFFGLYEASNQYGDKGHWGYNPKVIGYPYNPDKARKLLAEAGYPNGFKTKITMISDPEENKGWMAAVNYLKDVGIDAQVELVQQTKLLQITQGGKWEGLHPNSISPNPDVVVPLSTRYGGVGAFTMMLAPDDYRAAIQKAVTAPDFKTKVKWTQEAQRLMIDKYALQIILYSPGDFAISVPKVHGHGFSVTPNSGIWTPEDAWIQR